MSSSGFVSRGKVSSLITRGLLICYLTILVWAPLPLGSNRVWAWSILEISVFLLGAVCLLVWLIQTRGREQIGEIFKTRGRLALFLFAGWLLVLALQIVPLPSSMIAHISSANAEWYSDLSPYQELALISFSADASASFSFLIKQIAYVVFFAITLFLINSRRRLKLVVRVLILAALFQAIYGLLAYFMRDAFPFWRPQWLGHDWASGTFLNKNHYAAILSVGIALAIGQCVPLIARTSKTSYSNIRVQVSAAIDTVLNPRSIWFGALFILLSAFFIAHSRGALLGLGVAVFAWLCFGFWQDKNSIERKMLPWLGGVALLSAAWLGFSGLFGSLASLDAASGRVNLWIQSLQLIPDHWLLGTGGGTYEFVMTRLKTPELGDFVYNYAHNDHLQILIEQGVIGTGLFYSAVGICWLRILQSSIRGHGSSERRGLLAGILIAITAFFLHGFVDFNFYIPSNALWFFALLALGLVAVRLRNVQTDR